MIFFAHFKTLLPKSLSKVIFVVFALAFFSLGALSADAQNSGIVINTFPKHPGPFQEVKISVEDYSRDINNTNISWSVNGKTAQAGVGLKELKLQSGGLGSVSTVSINIGGTVRTVTIRPASVDLLWQADTYTPPFYAGKALHSNQDPIIVVAEPFFVNSKKERLDPNKLTYRWLQDGNVVQAASGYGKKTFSVNPSILLKPIQIEVEVSSSDGVYQATSRITIADTKPETLAYEDHPLYGIVFERALNGKEFVMAGSETKIFAAPLYFSNEQEDRGSLLYNWNLNNANITEKGSEIVFRKPENVRQGTSFVSVNTKNPERFMQFSDASFNIRFNNDTGATN
jgi:hypothetical protein